MQVIFVRHGEPAWIVDGITRADPGLTERGHEQAHRTAARLGALDPPLTEILVSPALRSQQTAAPLAAATALAPTTVDGLAEIRVPSMDGRPEAEVERAFREARRRPPEDWWDGFPGGETFREFHDRVTETLHAELGARGLRRDARGRPYLWQADEPDHRIAVVAHGGTNSVSIGWLLDVAPAPWEWERFLLGHCSLAVVAAIELAGAHAFSLRAFNDRDHLPEPMRTR
jgi:probable phosphoglycerate mutase